MFEDVGYVGVVCYVQQLFGWVVWIQWDIGGIGFEDGEYGYDEVVVLFYVQFDVVFVFDVGFV